MTRYELETRYTSEIVGSQEHSRLSALVSINEILDNLLPLPYRVLDNTINGESWTIDLIMSNIRIWIFGQSVPTFRFTRWVEIQDQIEDKYRRTPEILNFPIESWHSINPELCKLIYLQECQAARCRLEEDGYALREEPPAASLGRKGGQSTTPAKTEASRTNGKKGGRPARDFSAFD